MKNFLFYIFFSFIFFSCSQNKNNNTTSSTVDTAGKKDNAETGFIPVTSILKGQMAMLDSFPVTILQITTVNNKQDSAWLPVEKVKPLLAPFFSPEIDEKNMSSVFKESKFNDESTGAITFTYGPKAPLPDSMSLRHWDVYIDPQKNTIKRIYIVKQLMEKDIPATQQLTWQTGKWAKIVTISNDKNNIKPTVNEIKWVWDLNE